MSGYPPGVTGSEPQIAGWPPCGACGCPDDEHVGEGDRNDEGVLTGCENADGCTGYTSVRAERDEPLTEWLLVEGEYEPDAL